MKRPFAVIGFTMLFLSVILCKISIKATVFVFLLSAVVFLFLFIIRKHFKNRIVFFVLIAVISFSFSFLLSQFKIFNLNNNYVNETVNIDGTVTEIYKTTDYQYFYTIKVNKVNDKNKHFKIKYISHDNLFLKEGNKIAGNVKLCDSGEFAYFIENNLSQKVMFTSFNGEDGHVFKTGENNILYKFRGTLKDYYKKVIETYLPNENGGFANAIVIGDRSGIESGTFDTFNFAGTSHILVISGLHLTVWAFGLVQLLQRSKKLRKSANIFGVIGILFYSALTGFSVSIMRAGIMVSTILIGEMFKRESESINSLGIALSFILLCNPCAIFSIGFWFSFLSTLGILVISETFRTMIYKYNNKLTEKILSNSLLRFLIETLSINVATTLFTLPVFVFKTKIIPIFAVLSNLLIINIAFIVMILAVLGLALHIIHFYPLATGIYGLVGFLSNLIFKITNVIGYNKWSTISANHKLYSYLILSLVIILFVGIAFKMRDIDITKHLIVLSIVLSILTMTYCTIYEYNTPSVTCVRTQKGLATVISSKGNCIILGKITTKEIPELQKILKSHNMKSIDAIVIEGSKNKRPSQFLNVFSAYGDCKNLLIYDDLSCGISLNDTVHIQYDKNLKGTVLKSNGSTILILNGGLNKNIFKNLEKYDIIIHSTAKDDENFNMDIYAVENISLSRDDKYTVYFNREKIKWEK